MIKMFLILNKKNISIILSNFHFRFGTTCVRTGRTRAVWKGRGSSAAHLTLLDDGYGSRPGVLGAHRQRRVVSSYAVRVGIATLDHMLSRVATSVLAVEIRVGVVDTRRGLIALTHDIIYGREWFGGRSRSGRWAHRLRLTLLLRRELILELFGDYRAGLDCVTGTSRRGSQNTTLRGMLLIEAVSRRGVLSAREKSGRGRIRIRHSFSGVHTSVIGGELSSLRGRYAWGSIRCFYRLLSLLL